MTEEKWRKALDLYLAAAALPPEKREALLVSSSIDSEMMQRLIGALEDAESRSRDNVPVARHRFRYRTDRNAGGPLRRYRFARPGRHG